MTTYVLHPGSVRSIRDGDVHFIGANHLAALYGLKPGQFVVKPDPIKDRAAWCRWRDPFDAVHLHPRADGDYRTMRRAA